MLRGISSSRVIVALLVCLVIFAPGAYAETLQSNNYKLDESSIGTSNPIGQQSSNFKLNSATGDIGVGNSASSNFQINAGSKTSADPVLSFSVNSTLTNFGVFSASSPTVATTSFSVMDYTSYGYTVQLVGSPPSNGAHTIAPLTTAAQSQFGTEQFGVNLVANTSPSSIGSNPDNGAFGFGSVDDNYNTPNYYRYVSGDTIAKSAKSSGVTNYTISYLVNVAGLTPGGKYTTNQTLIVLGTY
jgi:hypothetical protein